MIAQKREAVDPMHPELSVAEQCRMLRLNRSTYYYSPNMEGKANLQLMHLMDKQHMETPYYGYRSMWQMLHRRGYQVNLKRVRRLWRLTGLTAVYPKPRTSRRNRQHRIYTYLLKNLPIVRPNQVWCSDITYIPIRRGWLYLVAVMDWYSRKVLSWRISNCMDSQFCVEALESAIARYGRPEIFNTDQGSQFTSTAFTQVLRNHHVQISMDGRGSYFDNIFIERLWRSVKYQYVYLNLPETGSELRNGLRAFFTEYNSRWHQSLGRMSPNESYQQFGCLTNKRKKEAKKEKGDNNNRIEFHSPYIRLNPV